MFDLKWIREAPEAFDRGLARRGLEPQSPKVLELDRQRRELHTELQELQNRRNAASKQIGQKMKAGESAAAEQLKQEVGELKGRMGELETREQELEQQLDDLLARLPNLPADDVPDGDDEAANVEVRRWGESREIEHPKQHFELGEALGLMDFEAAAKLSGSRFVVMKGEIARLHRALGQFMVDLHTRENGYLEVNPPVLLRDAALYGTGQLPKFGDDLFRTFAPDEEAIEQARYDYGVLLEEKYAEIISNFETAEEQKAEIRKTWLQLSKDLRHTIENAKRRLWLSPTAEVPLTNLVADEILEEAQLPQRFTALTLCFRAEAGAAGKDTRGMLRQHQFEKCELVSIAHPERAWDELERMVGCAEQVLQTLELPYRVVTLCTGDLGAAARKTYDIEVWLPGQGLYREISSCSNTGDFQARRMKARYRPQDSKGTRFVHTLNGSGVAVGRALIAVLENHQQPDGTIRIPEALRPYLGGQETIRPDA